MKQKFFNVLVVLMVIAMLPGVAMAAPSTNSILHGSAPAWANSKNYTGAADPNAAIGFRVYLGWQNSDAAAAFSRAVSDPKSSQYGQYVNAAQFRKQFSPSQSQVGSVQNWLKSQGFTVKYNPSNNQY